MLRSFLNGLVGRKKNPKEKISFKDLVLLLEGINGWTLISGVNLNGYINSVPYKFRGADPEMVALFLRSGCGSFECERQVYLGDRTEKHYIILTKPDSENTRIRIKYALRKTS